MALVYVKGYRDKQQVPFETALSAAYDALVKSPYEFDAVATWKNLAERVKQGVYMGEGFFLPHTRVPGLKEPLIAFVVCDEGFSGVEDLMRGAYEKAQFMCLLLSPAESALAHTKTIAEMAKRMLDRSWKYMTLVVRTDEELRDLFDKKF